MNAACLSSQSLWRWIGRGPVCHVAPHSDDAAFSSAGVLHACALRALPIRIVTCFSISGHCREALGPGVGPGGDPAAISRARKEEDRRFAATLPGPVTLRWLDLVDAPLRPTHLGQHPFKEATMTPDDLMLVTAIEALLAAERDQATLLLAPLGLGGHLDHLIVRDACAHLARRGTAVAFWEDLPYAGRVGLDELAREIEASKAALGLDLRPWLLIDEGLEERKQAALACYPSQVVEVHRRGVLDHLRRVAGTGAPAERLWLPTADG